MSDVSVSAGPVAKATKRPRTRSTRKPIDSAARVASAPVAKSKDPNKTKVSVHLDHEVADKAFVKARMLRVDMSDYMNSLVGQDVRSIVMYDSRESRASSPASEAVPIMESAEV